MARYKKISAEEPTDRASAGVDFWKMFVGLELPQGPRARIFESDGRARELGSKLNEFPPYGPPRRGALWEVVGNNAERRGELFRRLRDLFGRRFPKPISSRRYSVARTFFDSPSNNFRLGREFPLEW